MGETLATLEAEYCPPLDPALLSAILSDYNLEDAKSLEDAKGILNQLKEDASIEEAAGFDPSGTGASDRAENGENGSGSQQDTSASFSRETDMTHISNELSSLGLEDTHPEWGLSASDLDEPEGFETLDEDAKVRRLRGVVGQRVNDYSIRHALRKCIGNWDTAVNDLLTQAYLAETANGEEGLKSSSKGVEGFSEDNTWSRGRKGKARKKRVGKLVQRRSSSVPGLGEDQPESSPNQWTTASKDINFVATRTGISYTKVSSTYYSVNASLSKTVATLLKASLHDGKKADADETAIAVEAEYLGEEFPLVSTEYRVAIVRLAYPSSTAAHELATALTTKRQDAGAGGLLIIPQYAQSDVLGSSLDVNTITRKARSANVSRSPSLNASTSTAQREAYHAARSEAFAKATAAHRKAKPDRLMGGAAAYYGQVGREYSALSMSATADAADALVRSQSSATQLDLHGVDVLNAVRIASEKVEEWWEGLGESRVNGRVGADDRQVGYRIVVGLGRHSEGGKGKLGPAVSKRLREEGWKVEVVGAVIVVKGPVRR